MNFFALSFLTISIVIFIATIIIAFIKREEIKYSLKIFLIGIIITNFIMLSSLFYFGNVYTKSGIIYDNSEDLPFILLHNSEYEISTENKAFFSVVYALINTPKMGTFGLKYPVIYAAAFDFPWNLGSVYGIFILILSIITPIVVCGFLVSYIKAIRYFLCYHLQYRRRNVYYFSELNEKALFLAEDIYKNSEKGKQKPLIVFCNCEKVESSFQEGNTLKKYIFLPENELKFVSKHFNKKNSYYYFEISQDDSRNLFDTKLLIDEYKKIKGDFFENVKVFLFMNSTLFGSELISSEENKKINVILVDSVKTSIYNLLFEKPLFEEINNNMKDTNGRKLLSIAVFGNGVYAKEFFKNSIWASVLDERYKTYISYIDKEASIYKGSLERDCPELFKQSYELNFYDTNLQTSDLCDVLREKISKPNYIVIDTGNDEENLKLAIFLRVFYLQNSENFNYKPFIAIRFQNSKMANRVMDFSVGNGIKYEFFPFGHDTEIYSYNFLIESPVEKLAINCKAAYDAINIEEDSLEYTEKELPIRDYTIRDYNKDEFEKSSNRAAAVHIKNKLFLMGLKLVSYKGDPTMEQRDDNTKAIQIFEDSLEEFIEKCKMIEHERWNVFHYLEGWKSPTLEETWDNERIKEKKHKFVLGKMHACLCTWEQLDKVEEKYGKKFKKYDEIFIKGIPTITGCCTEKKEGNISDAKFLLSEIK